MTERRIRLNTKDVVRFVEAACKCDFDIDIAYNRYRVDAKSILGVYGLDLSKELVVSYCGYNPDFEAALKTFAKAC